MRIVPLIAAAACICLLPGCIASKVISAPFKAVGTVVETAVDATTQTRSEREEDVGRRVLANRKQQFKQCEQEAQTKKERRNCKEAYESAD